MELTTCDPADSLVPKESIFNRRRGPRIGGQFGLTFSGVDGNRFLMGDGQVMDLSDEGIGIHANRLLKPGMDLALFIELPDSEDHLCIPEVRISWVNGRRFGVALRTLRVEDQNRLRFFLWERASTARVGNIDGFQQGGEV